VRLGELIEQDLGWTRNDRSIRKPAAKPTVLSWGIRVKMLCGIGE
jgi:hypothetical protein